MARKTSYCNPNKFTFKLVLGITVDCHIYEHLKEEGVEGMGIKKLNRKSTSLRMFFEKNINTVRSKKYFERKLK